ncbi:efflux RND transporter periplasmic adaptor subunit [Shewanella benthica]|uniref:efflux RND transporter periplasmic adaptor subunit n=1 Tax=Shewanella benthica TaxID=43661 RepID=UPI00187AC525|nr:efflux RND transporter periplasmic adaptor subunit [Shewanella benthica]MBE7213836.1 efflux RND transporter periplasmic adaptor subunit [Shewanella benthica]MCL1061742.1 efflux RND transporter periplasmic adaptor subunit [Shewanella benthica]
MSILTAVSNSRVSISLLLTLSLAACQGEVTQHAGSPIVQTVTTATLTLSPSYHHTQEFTGTIKAGNTTGIGFELAGKIKLIAVDSGDSVQLGQLLAQLDTRLLEAEQDELNASVLQNSADLQLAKSTLNRSLELQKQGYTSEQTLDELKGQLNSLKAGQKRLKAAVYANALRIEKSSLLAPFDGVISKRSSNLGEVITLGSAIFTLVENNNPQAIIGVPVNVAQHLSPQQKISLRVAKTNYWAHIEGIGAEVNSVTRTVPIRLSLPKDAKVLNGEIAYLAYEKEIHQAGFWVPISALTDGIRGLWNLYVLRSDLDQDNHETFNIERRDIEILYTKNDMAFIRGAVHVDEAYIDRGLHKLVVGQRVKPTSTAATAAR